MRVVVLGPGASGKSAFAQRLAGATGIPSIELDERFWGPRLEPTSRERWIEIQAGLVQGEEWIMDGDLGLYDVVEVRLRAADTVVLLDLPTWVCAWRALRRSRQRADFWRWLLSWRRRHRPELMRAIAEHARDAELIVVRSQRALDRVIDELARQPGT
jgi:adenylate kinase family enzyme